MKKYSEPEIRLVALLQMERTALDVSLELDPDLEGGDGSDYGDLL